jgi:tetratricopeptide (TPR) repeat protein
MSGAVSGQVVQAGSIGAVHFHGPRVEPVIPHQLPPAPKLFAGRGRELAQLDAWLDVDEALVAVVSGPGGVGKTSLALRWLHGARSRFPDGQLYVDLGADSADGPVTPAEVLEWFLLALGVPSADIPLGLARRQSAFRTLTADGAVALLLDGAVSAAQVRPLLPASSRSAVVVTSRWRLSGLAADGARFVDVGSFDENASVELLTRALGERVASELGAARELARLCGGLPIALSVVGARLSTRPKRSLSMEVGTLRAGRLTALKLDEELSVEAVFDLSYSELPAHHARVYRRCGLHPGVSFGLGAVAAAAGEPEDEVRAVVEQLVEKNLLTEVGDERFRFHDLLRLHARRQTEGDPATESEAVVRRMVEWYLDRAVAADRTAMPARPRVGPRYDEVEEAFPDRSVALDWLELERGNLVAAIKAAERHGWTELVWQLAEAMWSLFVYRHHYEDWVHTHESAVEAAHRSAFPLAESRMRVQLGFAFIGVGRNEDAAGQLTEALRLARELDDLGGQATATLHLGRVLRSTGDVEGALTRFREALALETALGRRRGEALAHRRVGEALNDLGRHEEAVAEFAAAEAIMAELGQGPELARVRTMLAGPLLALGREDEATGLLRAALPVMTEVGSSDYVADVLLLLADVAARRGERAAEQDHIRAAADAYTRAGEPVPDRVRSRLAE